jgi:hypothetical protein
MWARLDDELMDHRKIFIAGELIGNNGGAIALGVYTLGLLWSLRHLTDGHLPIEVVKHFKHVAKPLRIADALTKAGLWEKNGNGFMIHDFREFNPTAADVKKRRKENRLRMARHRKES